MLAPRPAPPALPAPLAPFQTCLTCLATDVRMCDLQQYNLRKSYAALVGYQSGAEEGLPDTLCYECARKLIKFKAFRVMSRRAYTILRGLLDRYDGISESNVKEIDRKVNSLETTLACRTFVDVDIAPATEQSLNDHFLVEIKIKDETKVKLETEENYEAESNFDTESKYEADFQQMDPAECYASVIESKEEYVRRKKKPTTAKRKTSNDKKKRPKSDTSKTSKNEECKSEEKPRTRKRSRVNYSDEGNLKGSELSPLPGKASRRRRKPQRAPEPKAWTPEYYKSIAEVTVMNEEEQIEFLRRRADTARYKEATYRCEDCYLGYSSAQVLEKHLLKHHPSAGEFVCRVCKIRLKDKRLVNKHITRTHRTRYACNKCESVCSSSLCARVHASTHTDTTYHCDICDVKFNKVKTYKLHMNAKHPKPVACPTCGVTFLGHGVRNRHRVRVHHDIDDTTSAKEKEVWCSQCRVAFRCEAAYNMHRTTYPGHDTEHGLFGCEFCSEQFPEAGLVQEHSKTHGTLVRGGDIECEQCEERFPDGRKYFQHFRRVHKDKTRTQYYDGLQSGRRIMCEQCGKVFKDVTSYGMHMSMHVGLKPYKCDFCDKGFGSAYLLAQHRRVHTKEQPFKCDLCDKKFSVKTNYYRHLRHFHTDATPHSCDICGKFFKYRETVAKHILYVHHKQPWPKRVRTQRKKAPGEMYDTLEDLM